IVQSIQINVQEREPAAPILLNQRERRTAHVLRADAKALCETADKRRLPGAQVADEQDDGPRQELNGQLAPDGGGFGLGTGGDGHASSRSTTFRRAVISRIASLMCAARSPEVIETSPS